MLTPGCSWAPRSRLSSVAFTGRVALARVRQARATSKRMRITGLLLGFLVALFVPAAARAAGSLYVANYHDASISQYTIDPVTGALSPKSPATVATDQTPVHIAVSPDGKSAYVASFNGSVSQYTIDPVTGGLSPKSPATVAAGQSPWDVAVTPDGKSAYATNYGDNTVSEYNINPTTGTLSPKTTATIPTDQYPNQVIVSPDGHSAYVLNNRGSILQFTIDPATGGCRSLLQPARAQASIPTPWP